MRFSERRVEPDRFLIMRQRFRAATRRCERISETKMDGGFFWLKLDRFEVVVDGLWMFLLGRQEIGEIDVGASALRNATQGLPKVSLRLRHHPPTGQEQSPVHMSLGEFRFNLNRSLKLLLRLLEPALAHEHQAQAVHRLERIRPEPQD